MLFVVALLVVLGDPTAALPLLSVLCSDRVLLLLLWPLPLCCRLAMGLLVLLLDSETLWSEEKRRRLSRGTTSVSSRLPLRRPLVRS